MFSLCSEWGGGANSATWGQNRPVPTPAFNPSADRHRNRQVDIAALFIFCVAIVLSRRKMLSARGYVPDDASIVRRQKRGHQSPISWKDLCLKRRASCQPRFGLCELCQCSNLTDQRPSEPGILRVQRLGGEATGSRADHHRLILLCSSGEVGAPRMPLD